MVFVKPALYVLDCHQHIYGTYVAACGCHYSGLLASGTPDLGIWDYIKPSLISTFLCSCNISNTPIPHVYGAFQ